MNITEALWGSNGRAGRLAAVATLLAAALGGCASVAEMQRAYAAGDASQYDRILSIASRPEYPFATRKQAVKALGEIGDRRAVPVLVGVLREYDRRTTLKEEAVLALGQIGDPEAAAPIGQLLDYSLAATNAELRLAAVSVLGRLGGEKSSQILVNALAYYDAMALRAEASQMRGLFSGEERAWRLGRDSVRTAAGDLPMVGLLTEDGGSPTGFFGPGIDYVPEKVEETTQQERDAAHASLVRIGAAAVPVIRQYLASREVTHTLGDELRRIVAQIEERGS